MKLTGEQRKILREGVIGAYPSPENLKILLSEEMEVTFDEIANGGNYDAQVFSLIRNFEADGRIEKFIRVVVRDKPVSPHLKRIKNEFACILNGNAEYKTDWVHNYPAIYSGIIWEKVEIQPANKNKTHRYTIKWGKWQYTSNFQGQDVVYLWHIKGNDGQSIPIRFHIEPASKVTFEKGSQPPIGAIDINDGWTEQ